jgi:DHA1 family tetracycline resistance protein-like MFS transporter
MIALFMTVFVDLVGFGIVLPLQPFYAQKLGAAPDVVTLVAASYTAMQFVFAPVWGRLSDRIGRKRVLLFTIAGSCAGYLWLAFAESLVMLFLARAFGGAMAANMGVAHAYVADVTPGADRAGAMGRIGAAAGLGFVAGPAIGGLLAGPDAVNPNYQLPFFAAAGFSALAFIAAVVFLRETSAAEAGGAMRRSAFQVLWTAIVQARLRLILALVFMTPFVFSGIETILALWSDHTLGWGPERNGYAYAFMGFVAVVVQGFAVGPLTRALGEGRVVACGAVAVMAGAVLAPVAGGAAGLYIALGLITGGVCVTGPTLTSLVSHYAGANERGTVLGLSQSSAGLGRILGPALSGTVFARMGPDWPFLAGALVMALMLALSLVLVRRPRAQ